MPAVVKRTEESVGISELEDTIVWPCFVKKSKNFFLNVFESIDENEVPHRATLWCGANLRAQFCAPFFQKNSKTFDVIRSKSYQ